jgi:tetraacyldisaccharide 4'-kinase
LLRAWWAPRPTLLARGLWPLSWLYRTLLLLRAPTSTQTTPVPVIVVGNLIVGGAGKTPTVIALARALTAAGWHPGVISRGYGRSGDEPRAVGRGDEVNAAGDEPTLIARATGVPVWVGRQRVEVLKRLCAAQPQVNVVISDDGLQHHALARQLEVLVFDERGVGNGYLLPAGPLREPMWTVLTPKARVLYNADATTTALPGALIQRGLGDAVALADWARGEPPHGRPLHHFVAQRCIAAAGIAAPERFFSMLEAAGLTIERLPLPDHHRFDTLPWPDDDVDVFVTEKDAVKLAARSANASRARVWVVGLDFRLPDDFLRWVLHNLGPKRHPSTP